MQRDWDRPDRNEWIDALERAGHINGASDLGMWPVGQRLPGPLLAAA